jgi:hypothetical protein
MAKKTWRKRQYALGAMDNEAAREGWYTGDMTMNSKASLVRPEGQIDARVAEDRTL